MKSSQSKDFHIFRKQFFVSNEIYPGFVRPCLSISKKTATVRKEKEGILNERLLQSCLTVE